MLSSALKIRSKGSKSLLTRCQSHPSLFGGSSIGGCFIGGCCSGGCSRGGISVGGISVGGSSLGVLSLKLSAVTTIILSASTRPSLLLSLADPCSGLGAHSALTTACPSLPASSLRACCSRDISASIAAIRL